MASSKRRFLPTPSVACVVPIISTICACANGRISTPSCVRVQENCDIAESDNLVIYGHHIKGGKMFGALEDYKSKSFYEEHKNIQFDTLTEQAEYEIVAVFKTVAYSSEGFRYYDFVDAENEEDFNSYVGKCKELALYDTGVTAEYGDRLITFSTCEYSAQNGRLVVVAKKVG